MNIVLFNGPPRSGKDTGSKMVRGLWRECKHEKFSRPLKEAFASVMGTPLDEDFNLPEYENKKDMVIPVLGVSCRQFQIDYSEKFMKPMYGEDIFGRLLALRISQRGWGSKSMMAISDCGFQVEIDAVQALLAPGETHRFLLVRMHRPGCDYTGDSRGYVTSRGAFPEVDLYNDGDGRDLTGKIMDLVGRWKDA